MSVRIAPSLLSADFARLADALAMAEAGGADLVHVDVMDGHFVPSLTIGPPGVRALRKAPKLPLDIPLTIERPERTPPESPDAGVEWGSAHGETPPRRSEASGGLRRAPDEAAPGRCRRPVPHARRRLRRGVQERWRREEARQDHPGAAHAAQGSPLREGQDSDRQEEVRRGPQIP